MEHDASVKLYTQDHIAEIVRALGQLRFSASTNTRVTNLHTPDEIVTWLGAFGENLARATDVAAQQKRELDQLQYERRVVRQFFGIES